MYKIFSCSYLLFLFLSFSLILSLSFYLSQESTTPKQEPWKIVVIAVAFFLILQTLVTVTYILKCKRKRNRFVWVWKEEHIYNIFFTPLLCNRKWFCTSYVCWCMFAVAQSQRECVKMESELLDMMQQTQTLMNGEHTNTHSEDLIMKLPTMLFRPQM